VVTQKDDQASVRVKVSNGYGEIQSAPAPLSVVYLFNGGFEQGGSGWTLWDPSVVLGTGYYSQVDPHGGLKWLCLGDWTQPATDYAIQDLPLPAGASSIQLAFWLGISNGTSTPATPANVFRVKVLDEGGATLATLATRDNTQAEVVGGKAVWKACGPFDLTAYAGRNVKLRLESTQPGARGTGTVFAVDDIQLAAVVGNQATISPAAVTIPLGAQASFTATVSGSPTENGVDWTIAAGGGTLSPARTPGDGSTPVLLTAGSAAGTYTLTATPVVTGGHAGTASVTLVDPAQVDVTVSGPATLLAGASGTFTSQVSSLTDTSTTWSCSGGSFASTTANGATWSAGLAGTYTLTAASAAAPSRTASFQVQVVDPASIQLVLDPPAATLLPGGATTLNVSGDLGAGVDWSVSGGATLASNGLSATVTVPAAAPLADTSYTVTAASRLDSSRKTTAILTVKGMDLNGDGALDPLDLLDLAQQWGRAGSADLDGDAAVDADDLQAFLSKL
jgi:hypothetical protein